MNWMTVTSRWKCTNKLEKRMQKGHNKTKSSEKPEYRLPENEKKRKECDNDAETMRLQRKKNKTKQNKESVPLQYVGYIGMCRCEGYGFQAVYSGLAFGWRAGNFN